MKKNLVLLVAPFFALILSLDTLFVNAQRAGYNAAPRPISDLRVDGSPPPWPPPGI